MLVHSFGFMTLCIFLDCNVALSIFLCCALSGFDTMWVTSVDNYQQDGVIFKGNVRNKDPAAAYAKLKQRLAVSMCN